MTATFWVVARALITELRRRHRIAHERPDAGSSVVETVIIVGGLALLAIAVVTWFTAKLLGKAHSINFG